MRRLVGTCIALVLGVSAMAVSVGSPAAAATVPPGFADSPVASFSRPTAVEWLPDSRIVVLEQDGRVRVGGPTGGFTTAIAIAIGVCGGGERVLHALGPEPSRRVRQPGEPVHVERVDDRPGERSRVARQHLVAGRQP
jgi:hypothetical protein